MAIYHFSGTVISRSQGRSAVACAAYRSGSQLHDERYDKTYDYTNKNDVVHTEILLPKEAPEWMADREKLWNAVEANEKRKDAQLAREFNFALPRELSIEQNTALAREFVIKEFVNEGMVADLCIHNDKMPDGQFQPHAHVMLTMREVKLDGFGQKVREWNNKENLLEWREAWAELANHHLLSNGYDIKIDHRTLKAQGIDLEPQYKIGSAVAKERLARFADHQRIAYENGEKLLEHPEIALHALSHQQSTFTHQDIARFVNRHTVDSTQFQAVFAKVKDSSQLIYLGKDDKNHDRFTTKEMLDVETKMVEHTISLSSRESHVITEDDKLHALSSKKLTEEQTIAFEHLTAPGDIKCVVGYAGTGKSYLLGAAREAWENQGYRVLGATLSGIAAENLTGSSGIESRTLASRFYYWDKGEQPLSSKDILVIDEAGMIGSRQMTKILEQAKNSGTKVVLIGDPEQLQAIEAGAAFRAISQRTGYVELMDIRRQNLDWQKEATREFATGQTVQAISRYSEHNHVHEYTTDIDAKKGLISLWNHARIASLETSQIILAYTRKEVAELNQMARDVRRELGELGIDHVVSTVRGETKLASSDRVYFLKNDRQLGVMNGTLGSVQSIDGKHITIALDKKDASSKEPSRTVTIHLDQYNHITHGYAATIHKAQGVTVDRSYILASKYMDRHATYVASTRHRNSADLFYSREVFANERELTQALGRERSKDVSIDYRGGKESFAKYRGINGDSQRKLYSQYEKEALEAQALIRKMARNVMDAPGQSEAREALGKYVVKISKQEGIMEYFTQHYPEFKKQVNQLVNAYQPVSAERNRGWERDEREI